MSEYEIFNDEDEVVPYETKKEKKPRRERNCKFENFVKAAFSLENLALSLGIISMFFSLFVGFLPLVSLSRGACITVAIFFFAAFACAFAGIIIESIKIAKEKKFVFSIQLFISIFALLIACISGPMTLSVAM